MTASPKLNKFELRVHKIKTDEEELFWEVYIAIDGIVINPKNVIDWNALTASCKQTGSYYILTCGCGVPECGWILQPVRVAVWKNRIRWRMPFPEPAREFQFDRIAMIKIIIKGISRIKREVEAAGLSDIDANPERWADYPVGPLGTNHSTIESCLNSLHKILEQT